MDRSTHEAVALIGDEAERFLKTDLGRTMLGLAQQEAELAYDALKSVSASDTEKIRELQAKIWRAETFETWLRELISDAEQSLRILQHQDEIDEDI